MRLFANKAYDRICQLKSFALKSSERNSTYVKNLFFGLFLLISFFSLCRQERNIAIIQVARKFFSSFKLLRMNEQVIEL